MSRNYQGVCYSFPIELPVQYKIDGRDDLSGSGRTLALSSEMVRLECGQRLPGGGKIRLILAWPAALPDGTRLNLWVEGVITKSALPEIQVQVLRYDFRTRRVPARAEAPMSSQAARGSAGRATRIPMLVAQS